MKKPEISSQEFATRRATLMQKLEANAIAIVPCGILKSTES